MGADLSKKEKVHVFYSCLKRGGFRLSISTFIHYVRRFFFSFTFSIDFNSGFTVFKYIFPGFRIC